MKKISILLIVGCIVLFAGCGGGSNVASTCAAKNYTVTDLGALDGTWSTASGINALGQVVGYSSVIPGSDLSPRHAFRTGPNRPIDPATDDLGTLGSMDSAGTAINDSGQAVGWDGFMTPSCRAFRTAPNSSVDPAMDDLGTLGGIDSHASGINNSGQVVGNSTTIGDTAIHAFRTAPNSAINPATDDLGTLGGGHSDAYGINASGQVVGSSKTSGGTAVHAFRTAPNSVINPATDDLGTLGGRYSEAYGINASGQVVGRADTPDCAPESFDCSANTHHAFRTAPNRPINPATDDLGTLGGLDSGAAAINDSGQVVGSSEGTDGKTRPFLYSDGVMYDLNKLIPAGSGWELLSAVGINNGGQIAGTGYRSGVERAFLLTPVCN